MALPLATPKALALIGQNFGELEGRTRPLHEGVDGSDAEIGLETRLPHANDELTEWDFKSRGSEVS